MDNRFIRFIFVALLVLTASSSFAGGWADSWNGMHSFLVFAPHGDFTPQYISSIAHRYDFGWSPRYGKALVAGNSSFVSASYASATQGEAENYAWFQVHHPDWILYGCDRVTPILQFAYGAVSLDITNPEVIDYQFNAALSSSAASNGGPIAWDNFYLNNDFRLPTGIYGHACGVFDKNRRWVQKFAGNGSYAEVTDPLWTDAMIDYAAAIRDRLHALPTPRMLIPNADPKVVAGDAVRSAKLIAAVDGLLVEGGNFGPASIGDERKIWLRNIRFVEAMNQAGKAFYSIESPPAGTTIQGAYIQFTLASYLLAKGRAAALNILPPNDAGLYESDGLFWPAEFQSAGEIGFPCAPMSQADGIGGAEEGLFTREHSGGASLVNTSRTRSYTTELPGAGVYKDLYGSVVRSPVTVQPNTGLVLLKTSEASCLGKLLPRVTAITVNPAIVQVGASYSVTVSGSELNAPIYFDVRFRGPGGEGELEVMNWQHGDSAFHDVPVGTATGLWTITGVRVHQDEADHNGSFAVAPVTAAVFVVSAPSS